MKRVQYAAFAASLAIALAGTGLFAQQQGESASRRTKLPEAPRQFTGGGNWQSQRRDPEQHGWQVQLKHSDDDSLSGRITVAGSSLIQNARIEGQVSGNEIYGVLVDDNDAQVGTFTGSIFKQGMSGTYTTADGDTGNWNWDGAPPQ